MLKEITGKSAANHGRVETHDDNKISSKSEIVDFKKDRVRGTQMDAAGVPCKSRGHDDGIWNVTNDTTNTSNSDCGAGG
jgi:hypothetical protein